MKIHYNKTEQTLADDMGVDLEYASLIVPTMVICKNFLDIFQAEAVWVPRFLFLTELPMIMVRRKKIYQECP